ncbi:MAG: hypothetical protein MUD01_17060 [Chloroflexaceae bacterium]|jgi:hypothetical protein|nr:hypothetical protein [Chloroflexaceae bacterium]
MKRYDGRMLLGVGLMLLGALLLLQTVGIIPVLPNLIWAAISAGGGVLFLGVFLRDHRHWWGLIPGFILLGLGITIGLEDMGDWGDTFGGMVFLSMMGLGFWAVYFTKTQRWWAIIPGGVLVTLGFVAGLAETIADAEIGWVFFLGMAATFGLVAVAPTPQGQQRWAFYPAAGLLVLALVTMASVGSWLNLLWPLVLIGVGLTLAFRAMRSVKLPTASFPPTVRSSQPPPSAESLDDLRTTVPLVKKQVGGSAMAKPAQKEEETV